MRVVANVETGDRLRRVDHGDAYLTRSPALSDGEIPRVIDGTEACHISVRGLADGDSRWTVSGRSVSPLVVVGETLYFGTDAYEVVTMDYATGEVSWRYRPGTPTEVAAQVAPHEGLVLTRTAGSKTDYTDTGRIPAVDPSSQGLARAHESEEPMSAMCVAGDHVLAVTNERAFAVAVDDGSRERATDPGNFDEVAVAGAYAYTADYDAERVLRRL